MNSRLAHLLTRLYPRHWRERYGAEFEALLQSGRGDLRTDLRADLRTGANVVCSALREHIFPSRERSTSQNSHALGFQSLCVQAPWAVFALGPVFLLAGAYCIACLYLWFGWRIFLAGADTPFIPVGGPIYGLANIYFQAGKFYYFGAPVLIGWGIGTIAVHQRLKTVWPAAGLLLIAWMGGTAEIHASRTAVHAGLGHIRMDFALGTSAHGVPDNLFHAMVILSVTALPYLVWRLSTCLKTSG